MKKLGMMILTTLFLFLLIGCSATEIPTQDADDILDDTTQTTPDYSNKDLDDDITSYDSTITFSTNGITTSKTAIDIDDDGINASDPDVAALEGPFQSTENSNASLLISGGILYIESEDDAIDANGSVTISGGMIVIDGPTSGAQSAVDYDTTWNLTGGTIIAVAGYGNETKVPTDATQISFMYNTQSTQQAGTTIALYDGDELILAFTPDKNYQALIISTPTLDNDTTYTLTLGGIIDGTLENGYYTDATISNAQTLASFELDDTINTFNDSGSSSGGFPPRR